MLAFGLQGFAALPVTERDYLYEDSLIWVRLDSISGHIWDEIDRNPTKKDSLQSIYIHAFQGALKENVNTALRYASVPSGIQRVYMVRCSVPKDTIRRLLPALPDSIRNSYYGKLVDRHLSTKQLSEGDSLAGFPCQLPDSSPFDWATLQGKSVLVVYSGYFCMGNDGRQALRDLYDSTSRDSMEIVHYWVEPKDLKTMRHDAEKSGFNFAIVSDFLKDASPIKIIYGCQAMPTYYFFNSNHRLLYKGIPDEFPWEKMEQHLGIWQ